MKHQHFLKVKSCKHHVFHGSVMVNGEVLGFDAKKPRRKKVGSAMASELIALALASGARRGLGWSWMCSKKLIDHRLWIYQLEPHKAVAGTF